MLGGDIAACTEIRTLFAGLSEWPCWRQEEHLLVIVAMVASPVVRVTVVMVSVNEGVVEERAVLSVSPFI